MERLSCAERERYARQLLIQGWGEEGQTRLRHSCVLVVGVGGLGCPVTLYLAAAGVGELRICDADTVALSNLNRQIHYTDTDVGRPKAEVAAERLSRLNPGVRVRSWNARLDEETLQDMAAGADLLIDCLDNFSTRYVLNAYAVARGRPLLHGAVWGLGGQLALLSPPRTACLRCLFPEAPPPAPTFPVLGAGAARVASAQALLALRFLVGLPVPEIGALVMLEGDPLDCQRIELRRNPDCPECGSGEPEIPGG